MPIQTEEQVGHALRRILGIELVKGTPMEIEVRPVKKARSRNQNSLYWKWLTIIAEETGSAKDELHEHFKERFLIPMLVRDENDSFMKVHQEIWNTRPGFEHEASRKWIIQNLTTTTLSVKSMAEYLNEVNQFSLSLGIVLPLP